MRGPHEKDGTVFSTCIVLTVHTQLLTLNSASQIELNRLDLYIPSSSQTKRKIYQGPIPTKHIEKNKGTRTHMSNTCFPISFSIQDSLYPLKGTATFEAMA